MTSPLSENDRTPRDVVDTVTIAWLAVAGPLSCVCGHDHYGRTPQVAPDRIAGEPLVRMTVSNLSPQWDRCEDTTCGCTGLSHAINPPEGTSA